MGCGSINGNREKTETGAGGGVGGEEAGGTSPSGKDAEKDSSEGTSAPGGKLREGVPDGAFPAPSADLRALFQSQAPMGENPPEFDYGDQSTIVFHGYFGLLVCRRAGEGWNVFRALDLKRLGADATQGDDYAVIDAGREAAYITPAYFAPGNENPVTYCYRYGADILWEQRGYESSRNDLLSWSYSHSMPVQARIDGLMESIPGLCRCSNVYPVNGIGGGAYGFLVSDGKLLESLRYGIYREKEEQVELFPLFLKN